MHRESRDKLTHLLSPTSTTPPAFHVTSSVSMATADAAGRGSQHQSRFDVDVSSCRSMSKSASASSLTLPTPHRQFFDISAVLSYVLYARYHSENKIK